MSYAVAHKCFCKTEPECLSTLKIIYAHVTTCYKIVLSYVMTGEIKMLLH